MDGMNRRQVIRSLVGGSTLLPGILSWMLAEDRARAGEAGDAQRARGLGERGLGACREGGRVGGEAEEEEQNGEQKEDSEFFHDGPGGKDMPDRIQPGDKSPG